MKKILAVAVLALFTAVMAGTASAAGYGAAGCGLGSMIFHDEPGIIQIFAATTNGTFGNQTFGITSGTSNCGDPAMKMSNNDRMKEFMAANMDNLAQDIARGNGETLEAFADLLQIPAKDRAAFNQKLQANFAKVFTSDQVVLASVVDNAVAVSAQ